MQLQVLFDQLHVTVGITHFKLSTTFSEICSIPYEQKIIISLLENPKKRIEVANYLKVTSGSLNRPLNRLLDYDLIEYANDKYQITDPIFTYWLKNSYEKNGIYPFRSI